MRLERRAPQAEALSNSIVSLSWAMRRVELGPAPIRSREAFQMLLVGESRHRVVRLRLEANPHDAPFRGGGQHRQARARDQIVDECGEENRLACAREPSHAEAQGGAGKIVADRSGDEPCLEDEIAETWQGKIRAPTREAYLGGACRFGHPGGHFTP